MFKALMQKLTPQQREMAKASTHNTTRATRARPHSFFETIVFVDVGPDQIRYGIHKGLLCSRSDFFRAALTGKFRETEDQVVTLDDEDSDTFRIFNAWLYTGVLMEDPDPKDTPWSLLVNIYVFAEKRIIPLLQNAAIDEILRAHKKTSIPTEQIRHAWTSTAETSPLRRLLVDLRLKESDTYIVGEFQKNIDQYDVGYVAAVAIRAVELIDLTEDRANKFILLSLDCSDTKPDFKKEISQRGSVINDPWRLRCLRYHIHEPEDKRCEGWRTMKKLEERTFPLAIKRE